MDLDRLLAGCGNLFILTGAGISAESGVPTFRGGGNSMVWKGLPFEVLSSAEMVKKDLPLVWEWFDYRRSSLVECRPNAGHFAIAEAQNRGEFGSVTLVTQNIDGLHTVAGSPSVVELHGNINQALCLSCKSVTELSAFPDEKRPPICLACSDRIRPNVVLFGEMLPVGTIHRAQQMAADCDVCLVVGTSAVVYPANELPLIAKLNGAKLIELNPEETPLTRHCDISLRMNAADSLPAILRSASNEPLI